MRPEVAVNPTNPHEIVGASQQDRWPDGGARGSRGLFLGDYMGLETISGNDVINFFSSTISDGADVHALRANHP